jgi:hypothetical protein
MEVEMMPKLLAALAAIGLTIVVALPGPSQAGERRADGIRNIDQVEVSARRKKRRYVVRRYWGPRYYYGAPYYYDPYYAYGYYPYYYRRGPHVSVGPGGFSFGFGW